MNVRAFLLQLSIVALCLFCGQAVRAQYSNQAIGSPSPSGTLAKDTTMNKTNSKKWKDENARIYYKKINSEKRYIPDSALHSFQRNPFLQPWYRDMGNFGSPVSNMFFTTENRIGPTLGYHVYDVYRFSVDSLNYYNTTRPYAAFTYRLGSKLEQIAGLMYTQNIKPNWNFALDYRKINSPGYYAVQRNNHDIANLTTNYQSHNLHYQLKGAIVYNHIQHDENGGIPDSLLLDPNFNNKKTIPASFQNSVYSSTRSPVVNNLRDFEIMVQHGYMFGRTDTTYNADSTQYSTKLVPRFGISHKFLLGSEKHIYKDLTPDSLRYVGFFNQAFNNGDYPGIDSVFSQQKWFYVDNFFALNGFVGKDARQLTASVGVGNRIDKFTTNYVAGNDRQSIISNYVAGNINKEALSLGQWYYHADGKLYFTGADAGDFNLQAELGKTFKNNWAGFNIGFQQQLSSSPYNYEYYGNQYYQFSKSFNKESVTHIYAELSSPKLRLSIGVGNYLIANYLYINQNQLPDQYAPAFSITQAWLRKEFRLGVFVLDNELAYQQVPASAPVNVPSLLGRHQLSVEAYLFKRALKVATGVEVRYANSYYTPGYDPFLNRFYYQNTYYMSNPAEGSVFFNFRIKNFRAFIMADQVQQIFLRNVIYYVGYPAQDLTIRFGFTWVMMN